MATKMKTSIRIMPETLTRLRKAVANAELKTYDEWINKKLNEETKDKKCKNN